MAQNRTATASPSWIVQNNIPGRIFSVFIVGLILGLVVSRGVYIYYLWWSHRGRSAFIAHEALRFDRYMASPLFSIRLIVSAILLTAVLLIAYELLAAALLKLITTFTTPHPQR